MLSQRIVKFSVKTVAAVGHTSSSILPCYSWTHGDCLGVLLQRRVTGWSRRQEATWRYLFGGIPKFCKVVVVTIWWTLSQMFTEKILEMFNSSISQKTGLHWLSTLRLPAQHVARLDGTTTQRDLLLEASEAGKLWKLRGTQRGGFCRNSRAFGVMYDFCWFLVFFLNSSVYHTISFCLSFWRYESLASKCVYQIGRVPSSHFAGRGKLHALCR